MNYLVLLLVVTSIDKIASDSTAEENCKMTETCPEGDTCKKGYILNSAKTNCLPYVSEYYGECSEDAQCKDWVGELAICKHFCVCPNGYRWFQGECRPYVGLGQPCADPLDCFDGYNLQSLTCLNKTCSCSEDYYQRGETDCRKIASEEGDICALDIDCRFENGVCIKGVCATSSKVLLREQEIEPTSFSIQLHEQTPCENDDDCASIPNSKCYEKTGTCACEKTYFFNNNGTECIAELGVDINCSQDSDCKIKPGKCDNGICYCRDYYFVDNSNRNCIKTMSQQNWNCLSNEWCYALGNHSFCSTSSGTCACSSKSEYDEINVVCKSNGENGNNGTDSDLCASDNDCMPHSHCVDQSCQCEEYYELEDDQCVLPEHRLIGFPCQDHADCSVEYSECTNSTCQCVDNYFSSSKNDTCYKMNHELGEECQIDLQCSLGILYSGCVNETCVCLENYLPYNNYCYERKDYKSYCNNLMECSLSLGDGFQCRNRMCQCPTGLVKNEDKCSSSDIKNGNFFVVAVVLILKGLFATFC